MYPNGNKNVVLINSSDVVEVRYENGAIGVEAGSFTNIEYSTNNSTWTTTKPTRIDAGETTVYVRIVGDTNHNTVTCGNKTISISNKSL